MTSVVNFPTARHVVTMDLRQLKRLTGQTELKEVLAMMSGAEVDDLKSHVFGPWPLLRETCEQAAFVYTKDYPSHDPAQPLMVESIRAGVAAYHEASKTVRFAKPLAFIKAMMKCLQFSYQWQVVGIDPASGRRLAWGNMTTPIPVWMRKQDFVTLEYMPITGRAGCVREKWMYLAIKLIPAYCDEILDCLLVENMRAG